MNQGSDEWHEARRGLVTASRFGDVLARPTSKRRRLYLQELRLERAGQSLPEIPKPWFESGREFEAEARGTYAFLNGVDVRETGLITREDLGCGCSPDGLVGDDGGVEFKVRTSAQAHLTTIRKGMPSNYRPQVQGCMMVTGRAWWDFGSYYVNLKNPAENVLHVIRVYRDEGYISKLIEAIDKFNGELIE